ncbi:MAG: hypothetical protein JO115_24925 [Pseudonocardiales bacterium]|nr:hypothetical protein [Pseudonocardiales bacterium]
MDEDHGALRAWLHHYGKIIGRDRDRVYVVFVQGWQRLVTIPPQHLRLLDTVEGRWCPPPCHPGRSASQVPRRYPDPCGAFHHRCPRNL